MAVLGKLKLTAVHPDVKRNAEWALGWADYYGLPVTVTSGFRSLEEQRRLRDRWERGLSPFPANRPGDSSHNFGLAWDSVVADWAMPWWTHVRQLAGFEVPPGDVVHAQVPSWRQYV